MEFELSKCVCVNLKGGKIQEPDTIQLISGSETAGRELHRSYKYLGVQQILDHKPPIL